MLGGVSEFRRLHDEERDDGECLDVADGYRRPASDAQALHIAESVLGKEVVESVNSMGRRQRDAAIASLKASGLSARQIQRLTGVSLGTISNAGK